MAGAAFLAGCSKEMAPKERAANRPPETSLTSGPPDSTTATNYRVHLSWSGADPDGSVDHYDFILLDHPAIDDSISPADPNDPNRVVVAVPEANDPRWASTTVNDTTIVSRADTLRVDPAPPPGGDVSEHDQFVRMQSHERWHTFFLRAVDNRGLADPTPAYRSFNSRTLAPEVFLLPPVDPSASRFLVPRAVVFHWNGIDPVGDGTFAAPVASRYALVETRKVITSWPDYPRALYESNVAWSRWTRWDATDQSGVRAAVRGLRPVDGMESGYYLFAVQAMDEAGAVTPVFDAHTPGRNNVALLEVVDFQAPLLIVSEPTLNSYVFTSLSHPVGLIVAAGQPVTFRWRGDASSYGADIGAYRYGWNIRHPENDEEWDQGWCRSCRSAPTRAFTSGLQRFYLETRDELGLTASAVIELTVVPMAQSRELLLVDDGIRFQTAEEIAEDNRWQTVIDSLRQRRPFVFDRARDVYDVAEHQQALPPVNLIFDYKTIVWIEFKSSTSSALGHLAEFFDSALEANRNSVPPANYLSIFLDNGGKFWLSGQQPTEVLWRFGRAAPLRPYPLNVTNWSDDIDSHTAEDSAGVASFLWRFGAEAVDNGSGGRTVPERDGIAHYCLGFQRTTPLPGSAVTRLVPDPATWPQPNDPGSNPLLGRPFVEIYNMPAFLASQVPPLQPDPSLWLPLYTYESGVPADPAHGVVYPRTADGQPAIIVRKNRPTDPYYSRALCGFEPNRLRFESHLALADDILLQQFKVGLPDSPAPLVRHPLPH